MQEPCHSSDDSDAPSEKGSAETETRRLAEPETGTRPAGRRRQEDYAQLTPGSLVAGRYRITSLLGKGGMGEVYRADDLKLGEPVALKFLSGAADAAALQRFLAEVRIGRRISHPNVCRSYDVAEVHGRHFIAMEFVDGEDLASLLRRIGRLPEAKALELTRDICAGLAAANDLGIVHRDLKPGNIMIDGHGRARITDFGLAALTRDLSGRREFAGTPRYMAPEQLRGQAASTRSDVFALGLILYEMFTGERLVKATTLAEIAAFHDRGPPAPAGYPRSTDATVVRIIAQCLSPRPEDRPASARSVLAGLPGREPLEAAILAGETPSPDMLTSARIVGDLKPAAAWSCLAGVAAGLIAVLLLAARTRIEGLVPLEKPPEVLMERAREIAELAGYDTSGDSFGRFLVDAAHLDFVVRHDPTPQRWRRLQEARPPPLQFAYRRSPLPHVPWNPLEVDVSLDDPPMTLPGMILVRVDPAGRLVELRAVPPSFQEPQERPAARPPPDWNVFFAAADLRPGDFAAVPPRWTPPVASESRAAWTGAYAGRPEVPIRVEAAAYAGKPTFFLVLGPWDRPLEVMAVESSLVDQVVNTAGIAVAIALLVGAALLARSNYRRGRGDVKGSFRLAAFVFCLGAVTWIFWAEHVTSPTDEWSRFLYSAMQALWGSSLAWIFYMAVEPPLRRRLPHALIAWRRLLEGRFRDPLVGRDVLVGLLAGLVIYLNEELPIVVSEWLGRPPPDFIGAGGLWNLSSLASRIGLYLGTLLESLMVAFWFLVTFGLLQVVLRKRRLAILLVYALAAISFLYGEPPIAVVLGLFEIALGLYVLLRVGLLAGTSMVFTMQVAWETPFAFDLDSWYLPHAAAGLLVLATAAAYGFLTSLGGKPLFGRPLLEG